MAHNRRAVLVGLLGLCSVGVFAQGGPGPGRAASTASMPGPGMGPRGPGPGRWGSQYTPGWSMMTEAERNEHRERMRTMGSHQECKSYHEQHREQMAARAKERGLTAPRQPRGDPCRGFGK